MTYPSVPPGLQHHNYSLWHQNQQQMSPPGLLPTAFRALERLGAGVSSWLNQQSIPYASFQVPGAMVHYQLNQLPTPYASFQVPQVVQPIGPSPLEGLANRLYEIARCISEQGGLGTVNENQQKAILNDLNGCLQAWKAPQLGGPTTYYRKPLQQICTENPIQTECLHSIYRNLDLLQKQPTGNSSNRRALKPNFLSDIHKKVNKFAPLMTEIQQASQFGFDINLKTSSQLAAKIIAWDPKQQKLDHQSELNFFHDLASMNQYAAKILANEAIPAGSLDKSKIKNVLESKGSAGKNLEGIAQVAQLASQYLQTYCSTTSWNGPAWVYPPQPDISSLVQLVDKIDQINLDRGIALSKNTG